mgnify:CR=1 FL=1
MFNFNEHAVVGSLGHTEVLTEVAGTQFKQILNVCAGGDVQRACSGQVAGTHGGPERGGWHSI